MCCDSQSKVPLAAAILVGGRARRMGRPKQSVLWQDEQTMGQRMVLLALSVCETVLASGPTGSLDGVQCLEDATSWEGQGPLSGIATALMSGLAERWLIMPCDMPALTTEDLHRLIAMESTLACCAVEGHIRPLPMCVHASLGLSLSQFLHGGGRRVQDWTELHEPAIMPLAADRAININRPEDLPTPN